MLLTLFLSSQSGHADFANKTMSLLRNVMDIYRNQIEAGNINDDNDDIEDNDDNDDNDESDDNNDNDDNDDNDNIMISRYWNRKSIYSGKSWMRRKKNMI